MHLDHKKTRDTSVTRNETALLVAEAGSSGLLEQGCLNGAELHLFGISLGFRDPSYLGG